MAFSPIQICLASNVVGRIEDNGRSIDRTAVRTKTIERNLIAPDSTRSDRELLRLIRPPGFATAREVTDVRDAAWDWTPSGGRSTHRGDLLR